ncbi:hypothetical protein PR048_003165 [Dryococelus australis]|uniref:Innexin n=1 Tax=Dryococelus australis TaxID=614101 RepID=A0ABQ9IMB9_9NEOP|nr:hypothetical protein PR048_003165 [Dryococelus australis]
MIHVFDDLKARVKLGTIQGTIHIDNDVFQLHYKVTCNLLLGFSLIITTQQYVGDPIVCLSDGRVPSDVLDAYFLMSSTFTFPNRLSARVGVDVVQLGVFTPRGDAYRYATFYQWVCYCLILQSLMFYVPRYLWKVFEDGRMRALAAVINVSDTGDSGEQKRDMVVKYITKLWNRQNSYAIKFFLCEILNFLNVNGQFFFVDFFLDVLKGGVDPMRAVFPKQAKCHFFKYGRSGTVETIDGLCLLPLNNVHDAVFSALVFDFAFFRENFLRTYGYHATKDDIAVIVRNCQIGDWFVLYQLGKNIDPLFYREVLYDVAKHFKEEQDLIIP